MSDGLPEILLNGGSKKVNAIFIRSNTKRTLRNDIEQIPDVKRIRHLLQTSAIHFLRPSRALCPDQEFNWNCRCNQIGILINHWLYNFNISTSLYYYISFTCYLWYFSYNYIYRRPIFLQKDTQDLAQTWTTKRRFSQGVHPHHKNANGNGKKGNNR